MNFLRLIIQFLLTIVAFSMVSGCTHLRSVSVQPAALASGQVSPHRVALVIDDQLKSYNYKYDSSFLDTFEYPIGVPLQNYAEQIAKRCFQQVDIVASAQEAEAATSADLILIPRVVNSAYSVPVWGGQDVNLTLVVAWTAKDRVSQNTIWLKTITASAAEPKHLGSKEHERILNQKLFDDLSLKTYRAFQEASELR